METNLEANPTTLIKKWAGLPAELHGYGNAEEDLTEAIACLIFIKFTRQMWIALNDGWRIDSTWVIAPESIEEALSNWTVDSEDESSCHSSGSEELSRPLLGRWMTRYNKN